MYIQGLGEVFDRGQLENGPGMDNFRYAKTDQIIDGYIMMVRRTVKEDLHRYLNGTNSNPGAPTDLYEAERRIREELDEHGPAFALDLVLQEYAASAFECPAELNELPIDIQR